MLPQLNTIIHGDSLTKLGELPKESVHCIVTSPPYFGLRDYKVPPTKWPAVQFRMFGFEINIPEMECCLGLEMDHMAYIGHMLLIMREGYRVLRKDGTLWLNIADSYCRLICRLREGKYVNNYKQATNRASTQDKVAESHAYYKCDYIKPRDLIGIPWTLAMALREDGWYLRQENIWHKPNPMPESTKKRCTKAHESLFMLTKHSNNYYFDAEAIKTPVKDAERDLKRAQRQGWHNKNTPDKFRNGIRPVKSGNKMRKTGAERMCPENTGSNVCSSIPWEGTMANKRTVWTVPVTGFSDSHFAVYPEELIVDCIKAGCPEGGIVLDPFFGRGTTGVVARKLNRNYIGIDLGEENVNKIAPTYMHKELGMFK